jgi:hypothetical protein
MRIINQVKQILFFAAYVLCFAAIVVVPKTQVAFKKCIKKKKEKIIKFAQMQTTEKISTIEEANAWLQKNWLLKKGKEKNPTTRIKIDESQLASFKSFLAHANNELDPHAHMVVLGATVKTMKDRIEYAKHHPWQSIVILTGYRILECNPKGLNELEDLRALGINGLCDITTEEEAAKALTKQLKEQRDVVYINTVISDTRCANGERADTTDTMIALVAELDQINLKELIKIAEDEEKKTGKKHIEILLGKLRDKLIEKGINNDILSFIFVSSGASGGNILYQDTIITVALAKLPGRYSVETIGPQEDEITTKTLDAIARYVYSFLQLKELWEKQEKGEDVYFEFKYS